MLGPFERTLLAAGDADAEEVDALLGELGVAALGVAEVGVAAVDQDVAPVQVRRDLVDHRVGGWAGLDHAHQHPGRASAPTQSSTTAWPVIGPSEPCSSTNLVIRLVVRLCTATGMS